MEMARVAPPRPPTTATTFPKHISDWWYRKIVNSLAILLQFHKSMVSVTLEKSLGLRTMDMIINIKV